MPTKLINHHDPPLVYHPLCWASLWGFIAPLARLELSRSQLDGPACAQLARTCADTLRHPAQLQAHLAIVRQLRTAVLPDTPCPNCHRRGWVRAECELCDGSGYIDWDQLDFSEANLAALERFARASRRIEIVMTNW